MSADESNARPPGRYPLAAVKFRYTLPIKQRPYHLLLLTGLLLFLTSFLVLHESGAIDIYLHDTYFVIAHNHILWLLTILALFVWILYLLTVKILYSKALTWIHIIATILTILLLTLALFIGDNFMNPTPRRYYDYSNWNSLGNYTTFAKAISTIIFVLLLGQFVFVINLVAGFVKRRIRKT